jgi:hypothetical protein
MANPAHTSVFSARHATLFERRRADWVVDEGGCWLWRAAKGSNGYGVAPDPESGKTMGMHRASYLAYRGPIPPGMCVCHRCDVRACINPAHLFLGTSRDNIADMVAKERHARGERKNTAKLTEAQVREIRADRRSPQAVIARDYGINQSQVSYIKSGKKWGWLP